MRLLLNVSLIKLCSIYKKNKLQLSNNSCTPLNKNIRLSVRKFKSNGAC
jgi:hypothetical protein